jgi:subtilisin family serine protease
MSHGEHCECGGDAGRRRLMRKLFATLVLCISALTVSAPAMPVRADNALYEPEMIARKVVAPTSPQTSGPSGLQSPYNQVPWGLDRIDQRSNTLNNSYSFSGNGAGVKVYIVDSGVNATHREFGTNSRVVDGWSYRSDSSSLISYHRNITPQPKYGYNSSTGLPLNEFGQTTDTPVLIPSNITPCSSKPQFQQYAPPILFDDLVTDVVNSKKVYQSSLWTVNPVSTDKGKIDNDGHGTHVAGTIGGEFTGVAKGATIVPVRVLDSCGAGTATMVHRGLSWILANHVAGQPAVVNMSIGFDSSASTINQDISDLLAAGIVVVAAAGNESGSSCQTTPAGTPGTISVGAIDSTSSEAWYSNFGECVDIFAPGSDVLSSWPKNGTLNDYTYYSETGTSMAAPHVSGVVAIQLQGVTTTQSTPTTIWNWLKSKSICDVVAYRNSGLADVSQTPNRLLNMGTASPSVACRPQYVNATVANGSTTLTWTEPASPNGSALTGYTATLSPGGATCSTDSSTLTCTISGLTNNTTYTASVRGINAVGTSVQAATVNVTPLGVPLPVTSLAAGVANNSLVMTWNQQAGDGSGITYVATANPGGATCTAVNTNTCTVSGLTNGVSYTVSVVGTNSLGAAAAVTATGIPDGAPETPSSIATAMASKTITLSWPAITTTLGVIYKVTSTPGGATCTTTETTCTMIGLKNGTSYTFSVVAIAPSGKVSTSSTLSVRPGFTVKSTSVKKKSKTTLSKIVTSASTGKKTWSETGLCYISAGKLVAPSKVATCKVILKVAKSSKYPAMTTTVSVSVK